MSGIIARQFNNQPAMRTTVQEADELMDARIALSIGVLEGHDPIGSLFQENARHAKYETEGNRINMTRRMSSRI